MNVIDFNPIMWVLLVFHFLELKASILPTIRTSVCFLLEDCDCGGMDTVLYGLRWIKFNLLLSNSIKVRYSAPFHLVLFGRFIESKSNRNEE